MRKLSDHVLPASLLPCALMLVASASPRQESAMSQPLTDTQITTGNDTAEAAGAGPAGRAAIGPMPVAVSAAERPAPGSRVDTPTEAQGRRTLSTAFVRIGPGGTLTVEHHDGRVVVLRDVVMRRRDFCGVRAAGDSRGSRYCGGYGDVASARAGGASDPRN